MTGVEEPLWTYYMACGWHRGYFGMQINSPTERRIFFSVWDSGGEAVNRDKVGQKERVTLIDKGEGVYTGSFGNEGTGKADRLDRFMGLSDNHEFFLSHGGFVEGFTKFGTPFQRKSSGRSPAKMKLPPLPPVKK